MVVLLTFTLFFQFPFFKALLKRLIISFASIKDAALACEMIALKRNRSGQHYASTVSITLHPHPLLWSNTRRLRFVIKRGAGQMEDRVAPSLHVDGPAHVIVSCAFSSVIMTYRAVQISSTLRPNANNVYSITTSLLFTPSKGLNGKYWDWCGSLYSLTLPNITSLAFFVVIGNWCSLSKACVNPKSN